IRIGTQGSPEKKSRGKGTNTCLNFTNICWCSHQVHLSRGRSIMSGHRQFTLLLWVLCAAAVTLSANRVRAQCRHGAGSNPGISPGMLQQTVMQQQQLLQQQQMQLQLLQRVRQQQLLQTAQRNRQMRDLADKGPEALKAALRDPKPER